MFHVEHIQANAVNDSRNAMKLVALQNLMCESSKSHSQKGKNMALRKQFSGNVKADPELIALMEASRKINVTEEMLQEQRISFAFGNAMNADRITKDSVRATSKSIRLRA